MYAETAVAPALSAIAPARHWARDRLAEAGVDDGRLDLLVLLVSELVTNAVAHADPPVILRVHVDEERTRVEVTDGVREVPVVRNPPPTALGGRGVMFVDRLASSWGTVRGGRRGGEGRLVRAAARRRQRARPVHHRALTTPAAGPRRHLRPDRPEHQPADEHERRASRPDEQHLPLLGRGRDEHQHAEHRARHQPRDDHASPQPPLVAARRGTLTRPRLRLRGRRRTGTPPRRRPCAPCSLPNPTVKPRYRAARPCVHVGSAPRSRSPTVATSRMTSSSGSHSSRTVDVRRRCSAYRATTAAARNTQNAISHATTRAATGFCGWRRSCVHHAARRRAARPALADHARVHPSDDGPAAPGVLG